MTTAQARKIQRALSLTKNERANSEESRPSLWLLVQRLFMGPIGHIKGRVLALGPIITLPVLTVRHTSGRISASHRSVKAKTFRCLTGSQSALPVRHCQLWDHGR